MAKNNTKSSKAVRSARGAVVQQKSVPWGTVAAAAVVLLLAVVVFGYVFQQYQHRQAIKDSQAQADQQTAQFVPNQGNPDPSKTIPGVQTMDYPAQLHVTAQQRVAYDKTPPFGGPHDGVWADCSGMVYDQPVRSENMVHSLEHGAVWIAYNPDQISGDALEKLEMKVDGRPKTMLSPFPGLDKPIALQSWGHQLKVDNADDPRINQFITALRENNFGAYPEIGGSCQAYPGLFDPQNPPPFQAGPPPPDAVTMDGKGASTGGM